MTCLSFTCDPTNDPVVCAILGDLYRATGAENLGSFAVQGNLWHDASVGAHVDYCTIPEITCDTTTNAVVAMCVRSHAT